MCLNTFSLPCPSYGNNQLEVEKFLYFSNKNFHWINVCASEPFLSHFSNNTHLQTSEWSTVVVLLTKGKGTGGTRIIDIHLELLYIY